MGDTSGLGGEARGADWRMLRLGRPGGLRIGLAQLGASWISCQVPLRDGGWREVVLGNDLPERHARQTAWLGATVGRYANRIARARVEVDGRTYRLVANDGVHHLHGGPQGFGRRVWDVVRAGPDEAVFGIASPDGDQGYPGAVEAQVSYAIASDGLTLVIRFEATVTAATPLALTNHAYLNLDPQPVDVRRNRMSVLASHYFPVDPELIPLEGPYPVEGTDFDFRRSRPIESRFLDSLQQLIAGGYDHTWLLDPDAARRPAVELLSSDGCVAARLFTDQPAVQIYTGNKLAGTPGRNGDYRAYAGIAIEPGLPADSPNRPEWASYARAIARPGQPYRAEMRWQFLPLA
jgi:aldose 1-epimerase